MVTTATLQQVLDEWKEISGMDYCLLSAEGEPLAFTTSDLPAFSASLPEAAGTDAAPFPLADGLCCPVLVAGSLEYYLTLSPPAPIDPASLPVIGEMAACQIRKLAEIYGEHSEREQFLKDLLLDRLLLVDLYRHSHILRITADVPRIVLILQSPHLTDPRRIESIRPLLNMRDFIVSMNAQQTAIIRELSPEKGYEDIAALAKVLLDRFHQIGETEDRLSCGSIVVELKDLSRSYREAVAAMEAGQLFYPKESFFAFPSLGLARLICRMPLPVCRTFPEEILKSPADLFADPELVETAEAFFANHLNPTQTAKQLFIHRNTLIYRLDKIQKITGLDLRHFDDAMSFRLALMMQRRQ